MSDIFRVEKAIALISLTTKWTPRHQVPDITLTVNCFFEANFLRTQIFIVGLMLALNGVFTFVIFASS